MSFFSTSSTRVSRYLERPLRSYSDVLRQRADALATCDAHGLEEHLAAAGVVRRNYGAPCACDAAAIPHAAVNGAVYAGGGNGAGGHGTAPVNGTPMAAAVGDHAHAPSWNGPTFKADRPVLANFLAALAANPEAAAQTTAGFVEVHPRLAVRLVAKALAAQPQQAEKIVNAVKGKKRFGLSWIAVLALLAIELMALDRSAEAAPRDSGEPNDDRDRSGTEPASPLRTLWAVTAAVALVAVTTQMSASADASAQEMAGGEIGTSAAALDPLAAAAPHDASALDNAIATRTTQADIHAGGASMVASESEDQSSQPGRELVKQTVPDQQPPPGSTSPDLSTPATAAAPSPLSSESLAGPGGAAADPVVMSLGQMSPEGKLGGLPKWRLYAELGGPVDENGPSDWQDLFGQLWDQAFVEPLLQERPEWLDGPRELHALHERVTDALPLTLADVIDGSAPADLTPLRVLQHWLGEHGFTFESPPSLDQLPPVLAQVLIEQQQQTAEG